MASIQKGLMICALGLGLLMTVNSFAVGDGSDAAGTAKKHHHRGGFFLGICVGQTLAKATPPLFVEPGKHDPSIKGAKEQCKAAFKASRATASFS